MTVKNHVNEYDTNKYDTPKPDRKPRGDYKGTRKPREEDDKGTVIDCVECGFAYFSRWEQSWPNEKPPTRFLVCDRCNTTKIFHRNMATLAGNN